MDVLLAIPFGLAIGVAVGLLGGGGSVLAVPVLVYALDQNVADATTTSLVVVSAGALAGMQRHARFGRVCWRHAGSFTAAALPGILAGTMLADQVSGSILLVGFALIMLAAAQATWRGASENGDDDGAWERGDTCPPLRLPRDLVAGAAIGFLTGFLGVGGGFLIVPTLAIALAFTVRTAVGTSLAIISATSLLGVLIHLGAGRSARPRNHDRHGRSPAWSARSPARRSSVAYPNERSAVVSPRSSLRSPPTCCSPQPSSAVHPVADEQARLTDGRCDAVPPADHRRTGVGCDSPRQQIAPTCRTVRDVSHVAQDVERNHRQQPPRDHTRKPRLCSQSSAPRTRAPTTRRVRSRPTRRASSNAARAPAVAPAIVNNDPQTGPNNTPAASEGIVPGTSATVSRA